MTDKTSTNELTTACRHNSKHTKIRPSQIAISKTRTRQTIRAILPLIVITLSLYVFAPDPIHAQASPAATNFLRDTSKPKEFGLLLQAGKGLTDNRDDFKFLMAGVHAGKVLTRNFGPGPLHGNFEYAIEAFPFWQSYTPRFQRAKCVAIPNSSSILCSPPYTVGGTFTGASITPIILRWNFAGSRRVSPWVQGAGGVLWTNHKYPSFGSPILNLGNAGPYTDSSIWNFTPQGGIGIHYFATPRHSIDLSANAIHISSASLGDKNPGVNATVQFSIGYTWWK